MAKKRKRTRPGKKHRIIFISHSLKRVWRNLLFADIVLWIVWWVAPYSGSPYFLPPNDLYLAIAAIFLLFVMFVVFFLRSRGFVQAREGHILLRVPLFRLKIPYTHVENVRMAAFREIYRGVDLNWAMRRFLKPYFKETVATIILKTFPMSYGLLRIFIPNYLFTPKGAGFVVLIRDYIGFNTEVDSRLNEARNKLGFQEETAKITSDDEYDGYFNLFDD
jgi:hypothetical protein